ncbi:prepilin-type N-terminal cleavage/methylation domain-containing protein [Piscinibacter sp. HJYY11]|uniref:type II secretion system protein n=1 Tax=Piscinibacter sp. HJYY11 TaxID=2801333 RepID=UPI002873059A|nr:prepilin-type N-terminal cleavage/methylation domain-containing protein [Piscinibacter sp. HJYY11]
MFHTSSGRSTGGAVGFTLVELLVVLAIVALLLTVAMPRYMGSLQHAKEVVLRENLQTMRGAIDKYFADKGRFPSSLDELVEHRYLRAVPLDPVTESNRTWQLRVSGSDNGIADVASGASGISKEGRPYAAY